MQLYSCFWYSVSGVISKCISRSNLEVPVYPFRFGRKSTLLCRVIRMLGSQQQIIGKATQYSLRAAALKQFSSISQSCVQNIELLLTALHFDSKSIRSAVAEYTWHLAVKNFEKEKKSEAFTLSTVFDVFLKLWGWDHFPVKHVQSN